MFILVLFRSTLSTFPVFLLNSPLIILTESPFLASIFLLPCLFLNSFERFDERNLCLMCKGALALYFLCFLGCLLPFHCVENAFFILINSLRDFCHLRPSFHDFPCHNTLYLRSFRVSFVILKIG